VNRPRRSGLALGLGLAFALLGGGAACAAGPADAALPAPAVEPTVDLGGATVVDGTGRAGDLAPVEQAIAALEQRAGLALRVVYVSDFDDADADEDPAWADKEAAHLGIADPRTVLLAVAIDQRQKLVSVSAQAGLSDPQLSAAEDDDLIPALERSDWTGAAVAYARALGDLATGTSTGSAAALAPPGFDWAGAAPWLAPTAIIVLAIIGWIVVTIRIRILRRQRAR